MALTAQDINYLSNLVDDVGAFLDAFADVDDRFQEGLDRGIDSRLATFEFATAGDLSHLSEAKLVAAFQTFVEIKAAMVANDRAYIRDLLAVVRSWKR